jgi:hypothetical protein
MIFPPICKKDMVVGRMKVPISSHEATWTK